MIFSFCGNSLRFTYHVQEIESDSQKKPVVQNSSKSSVSDLKNRPVWRNPSHFSTGIKYALLRNFERRLQQNWSVDSVTIVQLSTQAIHY
ncbi:hypothetical protein QTP88_006378 [Uroleucon formosanum]